MTIIAGKNILLTGGSRGIGPIIAEALAKKGGHLALTARSEKLLISINKNINKYDNKSRIFLADKYMESISEISRIIKASTSAMSH